MFAFISFSVVFLIIAGSVFDYIRTSMKRSKAHRARKVYNYKSILVKTQRLLKGQFILPLSTQSALVCHNRAHIALKALAELERTKKYDQLARNVEDKIKNYESPSEEEQHFYAMLELPVKKSDRSQMLQLVMLLLMTLRVEHRKGRITSTNLDIETEQLDILVARLKADIYKEQALPYLQKKNYLKAKALFDKASELLLDINCDNEVVVTYVKDAIDSINVLSEGVNGVMEEKNHTFYDKFKKEVGEKEADAPREVDDMDVIFGKKIKY